MPDELTHKHQRDRERHGHGDDTVLESRRKCGNEALPVRIVNLGRHTGHTQGVVPQDGTERKQRERLDDECQRLLVNGEARHVLCDH